MNSNGRIETHAHMIPNVFRSYMRENNIEGAGGMPFPDWSPDAAITMMDERSIGTAILSVSAPGVHLGEKCVHAVLRGPSMKRRPNS